MRDILIRIVIAILALVILALWVITAPFYVAIVFVVTVLARLSLRLRLLWPGAPARGNSGDID